MSAGAQPGDAVVLTAVTCGARQAGDAVILRPCGLWSVVRPRRPRETGVRWEFARRLLRPIQSGWNQPRPVRPVVSIAWGANAEKADRAYRTFWVQWRQNTARDHAAALPWDRFRTRPSKAVQAPWVQWRPDTAHDRTSELPWGRFETRIDHGAQIPWGILRGKDKQVVFPMAWGTLTVRDSVREALWKTGTPHDDGKRLPWGPSGRRASRTLIVTWHPEPPGGEDGIPCPGAWVVVQVRRVYRVHNDAVVVRLPDREILPVTDLTISTDADSWCWALSATLFGPGAQALIEPVTAGDPVILEAAVNAHVWQFVIDAATHSKRFGQDSVSVRGRSRSALLAAPWVVPESGSQPDPYTANQLGEQVLDLTGWGLQWDLVDWLVPGGLLSYNGTPIERLAQLVKPVDGCLYTDPAASLITAYPRYPTASWTWEQETADLAIPAAALLAWQREPDNRPIRNGVYVSGTQAGVLANIKITGTAGDLQADMVADPLISDDQGTAARARGLSVLSATGPGAALAAECLLMPPGGGGPGLVRPGMLVCLADQKGRARRVNVSARWSSGLSVTQSIVLERREVEP